MIWFLYKILKRLTITNISGNNNNNSNNNMPQMNQQRISAPAPSKSSLKPFIPRPDDVKYKVRSDFL